MKKAKTMHARHKAILLGLLLAACADRTVDVVSDEGQDDSDDGMGESSTGTEDGSETVAACVDPDLCDPLECGPNGTECGDVWGLTACIDGECGPRFGGCFPGVATGIARTCSEICAIEDEQAVCVEGACRGATAWGFPDKHYLACWNGIEGATTVLDVGCDDLINFSDPSAEHVQCCCDFPGN